MVGFIYLLINNFLFIIFAAHISKIETCPSLIDKWNKLVCFILRYSSQGNWCKFIKCLQAKGDQFSRWNKKWQRSQNNRATFSLTSKASIKIIVQHKLNTRSYCNTLLNVLNQDPQIPTNFTSMKGDQTIYGWLLTWMYKSILNSFTANMKLSFEQI